MIKKFIQNLKNVYFNVLLNFIVHYGILIMQNNLINCVLNFLNFNSVEIS